MAETSHNVRASSSSLPGAARISGIRQRNGRRFSPPGPVVLQLDPAIRLDDGQFFELCRQNRDLRIERTATGELLIMSPAGGRTSDRNAAIIAQLYAWARQNGRGRIFDSSGGFRLDSGATRSPDAAWVELKRLRKLSRQERDRFLPLCPTFVIELRSPSDPLATVEAKLVELLDAGARLGWLIDPQEQRVHVYRPGAEVEILDAPGRVEADPELDGFVLEMAEIWDPEW